MAQSDNAYLSKKGAEKGDRPAPNWPFPLLSEQKITFLRRKRKFSPKKSSLASEEKNAHIRSCRPTRTYISNEVNAHAHQRHRTCFPNNQNPLDFIIFRSFFVSNSKSPQNIIIFLKRRIYWKQERQTTIKTTQSKILHQIPKNSKTLNLTRIVSSQVSRPVTRNVARKSGVF